MLLGDPARVISEMGLLEKSIFSKTHRRFTGSSVKTAVPEVPAAEEDGLGVFSVRRCRVRFVKEGEYG